MCGSRRHAAASLEMGPRVGLKTRGYETGLRGVASRRPERPRGVRDAPAQEGVFIVPSFHGRANSSARPPVPGKNAPSWYRSSPLTQVMRTRERSAMSVNGLQPHFE